MPLPSVKHIVFYTYYESPLGYVSFAFCLLNGREKITWPSKAVRDGVNAGICEKQSVMTQHYHTIEALLSQGFSKDSPVGCIVATSPTNDRPKCPSQVGIVCNVLWVSFVLPR